LKVDESVTCPKSFTVDLGQFFASSGGVVLKDFSLCDTFIGAGTRISTGVFLGCTSPEDRAQREKSAADAASKAAAEKMAADAASKAAADKIAAEKAANAKVETVKISAAVKKTTITCVKGKIVKKVTGVKPVCPKGYKKK
jgi:prophage DNA circulation protein